LFNLFRYKTPGKYADEFRVSYNSINVKQVKTLSWLILIIASIVRLANILFYENLNVIPRYQEYNLINYIQIIGSALFIMVSARALKTRQKKKLLKKTLTLLFVFFLISITFSTSYIVSLHNTKNTLMMLLVGIVTVSIFFLLERWEVIGFSFYIILLFIISISISSLNIQEKIFNIIVSIVLAFVLFGFSRYSYYFKSQHFFQVKQLEEKNREVEQLNRQKGEILAFVAHDLRNPLNNIEALSTMMLMEEEVQKNVQEEVEMVLDSAKQAKTIIYDLLEVIQESNANTLLPREEINLSSFLDQIVKTWQMNLSSERKINFQTGKDPVYAMVNPSKFLRVIDNLIGNALKFSPYHAPVYVSLETEDTQALITVTDFGIGIPPELLDKLFDQFSKAGRSGLQGEKSIGLGLHICRQIIEQHQGEILVNSTENKGSSFIVHIPLLA
jgi:signal transduction histidine kinase